MATRRTLTVRGIERLRPPETRTIIWDTHTPGLGLRVSPSGKKAFIVSLWVGDRKRWITLGRFPGLKLDKARQQAAEAKQAVQEGRDPAIEHQARKQALRDREDTFEAVLERFHKRHLSTLRTGERVHRTLDKQAKPVLKGRRLSEIAADDIMRLLARVQEQHGPIAANRLRAYLSKLFTWALRNDALARLEINPVEKVGRPGGDEKKRARSRALTDEEIKALWRAWDGLGWPFGDLFKLLLLTGQRRAEVAGMRWSELDLQAGLWRLPPARTKTSEAHEVPLSAPALEILEKAPRWTSDDGEERESEFVFTTTGDSPISGFGKPKARAEAASGVSGWILHDLRRTVRSGLAALGTDPHIGEMILNHASRSGVWAVYDRYSYLPQKRRALEEWGRKVQEIVAGRPAKVVSLSDIPSPGTAEGA